MDEVQASIGRGQARRPPGIVGRPPSAADRIKARALALLLLALAVGGCRPAARTPPSPPAAHQMPPSAAPQTPPALARPTPTPPETFEARTPFAVPASAELSVLWHGRPLLVGDSLAGLDGTEHEPELQVRETAAFRSVNLIRSDRGNPRFRRETAVRADGSLELTIKADYASYAELPGRGYTFRVPLAAFGGDVTFQARIGRASDTRLVEGTIAASAKNRSSLTGARRDALVREITFTGPDGALLFDGNPYGVTQMYTDYPFSGEPMGVFTVGISDGHLVFRSAQSNLGTTGGLYAQKIVIRDNPPPFELRHPYSTWSYRGGPDPLLAVAFRGAAVAPYQAAATVAYAADRGWGWEPPPAEAGDGSGKTFRIDLVPGTYIWTLTLGAAGGAESFRMDIDGQPVGLAIRPGEEASFPRLLSHAVTAEPDPETGKAPVRVRFGGDPDRLPDALALQPLTYRGEDFATRPLWVAAGLFEPDFGMVGEVPPAAPPVSPRRDRDWRRSMRMGDWSPAGHAATGFEYASPEAVERRVRELQAEGIDTIQQAALFFNLAFTHRWDDALRMIRAIADAAHRSGMTVIHHADVPVIVHMGTGHDYLLRHLDWLQRDVRFGFPTLSGMCLNHPGFRAELSARFARLARETGVDGFMLDEVQFFSKQLCGCRHCRDQFTRDTGLVLPDDPASATWFNPDDPLWISWLQWRQACVGRWNADLWETVRRENPAIVMMSYTTHHGLADRWAALEFGKGMFGELGGFNFPGTEIMSRNVFAAHRAVFAFRRLVAAVGDAAGHPVWGLVYHSDDPAFAYVGWALNRMHRQTTWMRLIEGVDMHRYLDWPDPTADPPARSAAEVAVLFSSTTRDFARGYAYWPDPLGISQQLSDRHIPHDFLVEQALSPETLARYRLVFAASFQCMSETQAEILRDYVANGGVLFATGATSSQDSRGLPLGGFQLADLFGVEATGTTAPAGTRARWEGGLEAALTQAHPLVTEPVEGAETLAVFLNPDGSRRGPAVVRHPVGRGVCFWSGIRFGAEMVEREATANAVWEFERKPDLEALFDRAVRAALGDDVFFRGVAIPRNMPVTVYRQGDALLVHLLNLTGAADLEPGDRVPARTAGEPFPELTEDVVFEVRFAASSATIVSPDFAGSRPVAVESRGNGITRVTVNREDARTYGIVQLVP